MVASSAVPEPALVTVKAVDPHVYPLYGEVKLNPPIGLRDAMQDGAVLISDDLRLRLKVGVGDSVRIGGLPFRVSAIILAEPDRMSGSFSVGPRLMMTQAGLERTGLIGIGSRASQRILFRLHQGGPELSAAEAELRRAFPEALVVNYRDLNPNVARGTPARHHVPESRQPDRTHHRRDRSRNGDARAPADAHGHDCSNEIDRRPLVSDTAHLSH